MPIRPENRGFYPIDWRELSAVIRFGRAKGRCEQCGRPHGETVMHMGGGVWWDAQRGTWRNEYGRAIRLGQKQDYLGKIRRTYVVLATAHLNHDVSDNSPGNLKAFCQRCHIVHDAEEHLRQRLLTYRKRKALGDLFLGLYRF